MSSRPRSKVKKFSWWGNGHDKAASVMKMKSTLSRMGIIRREEWILKISALREYVERFMGEDR